MAAATLSVTFTPQYNGCHLIGFRGNPAGDWCVYTDNTASTINVPKTVEIDLFDYEECLGAAYTPSPGDGPECEGVNIEFYVQPCCDETVPEVTDTVEFQNPDCQGWRVECAAPGTCGTFTFTDCYGVDHENVSIGNYAAVNICGTNLANKGGGTYTFSPAIANACCICKNVDVTNNDLLNAVTVYGFNCGREFISYQLGAGASTTFCHSGIAPWTTDPDGLTSSATTDCE